MGVCTRGGAGFSIPTIPKSKTLELNAQTENSTWDSCRRKYPLVIFRMLKQKKKIHCLEIEVYAIHLGVYFLPAVVSCTFH